MLSIASSSVLRFAYARLDRLRSIAKTFDDPDVAFYYFNNGGSKKPSSIIDLNTMEYIRE